MKDNPLRDEEYLGYRIGIEGFSELEGICARVDIWTAQQDANRDDPSASFIERLPSLVQRRSESWDRNDELALPQVMERALHRVRGAILLGRLAEVNEGRFLVSLEVNYAQRSDEYLRSLILNAFKRVFRHDPAQQGVIDFDDIGVALLEDIDPKAIEYILERLQGERLIEVAGLGHKPGARPYQPTPAGLAQADQLSVPERAPGLLLEEIVARVERTLNKLKPEVAESLRRQSVRVAEARELDEHEVGEVAQACEQIIWDFLDLDVLWEGVAEERPPKGNTRDRVRLLVRSKAPSETEQDLVEALEQYVAGWFGRLEQFIHKHRHLPQESERSHAKRFVVYTYLLIGDLIEVLGL